MLLLLLAMFSCMAASQPVVQLDALGLGVRVRLAPPGGVIVDPPLSAILLPAEGGLTPSASSPGPSVVNPAGNIMVTSDPASGLVTVTRLSDKTVVLRQTGLAWGQPAPGSRPGSVAATVTFQGAGQDERVYGTYGGCTAAQGHELCCRYHQEQDGYVPVWGLGERGCGWGRWLCVGCGLPSKQAR
jgi:hypothetical protein